MSCSFKSTCTLIFIFAVTGTGVLATAYRIPILAEGAELTLIVNIANFLVMVFIIQR